MLALVALAATAIYGGDLFGVRERLGSPATPVPRPVALSRTAGDQAAATPVTATSEPAKTVLRSQPWWQGVRTLNGTGAATATFPIDSGALQWRAKWTCRSGHLVARVAAGPHPLVDAACPGTGTGYATRTGATSLAISADGPWQVQVDQQVDVPLVEAPLAAMTAPGAKAVATAALYGIDQSGSGRITVYHLADSSYSLRLDDFFITPNVDLEIRFSPLPAPHTTDAYLGAPSVAVAPLDVTTGSINFAVPAAVDPTRYASVVIWCPLIRSAYAAATLVPSP